MNNLSFGAKLIIDESLYKKLPEGTPEGYIENLTSKYKSFIDRPKIKKATENDTIILSKAKYRNGFAIETKYILDNGKEPITGGIYTQEKIPKITAGELFFEFMQIVIHKAGIPLGRTSQRFENFKKAIDKLLSE